MTTPYVPDSFDPLLLGKFIEDSDELVNNGDLDPDLVEAGDGDGTEVPLKVWVPNDAYKNGGKFHTVLELVPSDDGKAIILNISPIGTDA